MYISINNLLYTDKVGSDYIRPKKYLFIPIKLQIWVGRPNREEILEAVHKFRKECP